MGEKSPYLSCCSTHHTLESIVEYSFTFKLYEEPTDMKTLIGYRQLSKEKSIKHWVSF